MTDVEAVIADTHRREWARVLAAVTANEAERAFLTEQIADFD